MDQKQVESKEEPEFKRVRIRYLQGVNEEIETTRTQVRASIRYLMDWRTNEKLTRKTEVRLAILLENLVLADLSLESATDMKDWYDVSLQ